MATTLNNRSLAVPDNTGGIRIKLDDSAVVDNIFIIQDGTSKFKIHPYSIGTYHPSWILGTTGDKTARFQAIINHSQIKTIIIDKEFTIDGTLTVPEDFILRFERGGKLIVNGTLNGGTISASSGQSIFGGTGVINISKVTGDYVSVRWFGAVGSGSVNDQPAIQKAGDTIIRNATLPRTLYFTHGTYRIDSALFFYKWTGVNYAFFSLNLVGQEAAHFNNTTTEAIIWATHTNTFAIGYQVARSSNIRGLVIKGEFNPTFADYRSYVNASYSTWASNFGVRDHPNSPYSGIVIDPVDNSNTLGASGRYPGMSAMYRGDGQLTNSGSSGVRIEQCRISNFAVDIAVSLNSITSNAENVHIIDCTLEVAKVAVAYGQDQTKDNFIIRCISWDRVHTLVDTLSYGRGTGLAPYVDGWNVAGDVIQLYKFSPLRSVASWRNIFAESLWRIGDGDAGAGFSFQDSTINFNINITPTIIPPTHITGSKVVFKNCVIKYYDNLFSKRMRIIGHNFRFESCQIDLLPVFDRAYGFENLIYAEFENCSTGDGIADTNFALKGLYSAPVNSIVAYGRTTFEEGGLKGGAGSNWIRNLKYTVDSGWPGKELRIGAFPMTINDAARTGAMTGLVGSNNQYRIAVGDYITGEAGYVLGRVTSIDRVAGSLTFDNVPIDVTTGFTDNWTIQWYERIGGAFIGDVTQGSNVITNCEYDDIFTPIVGRRLKIGHSLYDLIIDAINGTNITMSWNADYTKTKVFNPPAFFGSYKFSIQTVSLGFVAGLTVLIPEGAIFYIKANAYGEPIDVTLECIRAGWCSASTIGKIHQALFRRIGDIPPITVSANTTLSYLYEVVLVDTSAGNVTITVPAIDYAGYKWIVKKITSDTNTVIIDPLGSATINGATTKTLTKHNELAHITSDNTNLHTIDELDVIDTSITQQIHTVGTTVTITNQTSNIWLLVDPSSTLSSLGITLPSTPFDEQEVEISFGGTITSGQIVTALTISPNTGQSILELSTPSSVDAGEVIKYRYRIANTIWYRI